VNTSRHLRRLHVHAGRRHPEWSPFWPGGGASADATAYIIDAPNALFLAAALNTSIVTANIGENVGYAIGTGNTVTGFSAATLDQSTLNTTNTLPFRVIAPCTTSATSASSATGRSVHRLRLVRRRLQQPELQATDRLGVSPAGTEELRNAYCTCEHPLGASAGTV
jgi:hypothetical protein